MLQFGFAYVPRVRGCLATVLTYISFVSLDRIAEMPKFLSGFSTGFTHSDFVCHDFLSFHSQFTLSSLSVHSQCKLSTVGFLGSKQSKKKEGKESSIPWQDFFGPGQALRDGSLRYACYPDNFPVFELTREGVNLRTELPLLNIHLRMMVQDPAAEVASIRGRNGKIADAVHQMQQATLSTSILIANRFALQVVRRIVSAVEVGKIN